MKIESICLQIERKLSEHADYPIWGDVAAVVKIALAHLQMGIGMLFALLSSPLACCNDNAKKFFNRSLSHVIHGGANILAGLSELISGWMSFEVRKLRHCQNNDYYDDQYDKFVAYKCLVDDYRGARHTLSAQERERFFHPRKWIV